MKSWQKPSTSECDEQIYIFKIVILSIKSFSRVLGYPIILELSKSEIPELPAHNRPVFNYSMKGIVAAFSGIRKRDELVRITIVTRLTPALIFAFISVILQQTELVHCIHYMGGSIRKEMNHRATHLVCHQAFGDKYRYALTFRLNVMRTSWITEAWNSRHENDFHAKNEKFAFDHRLKIFENCRVAFIGFPEHEKVNMSNLLRSYNGFEVPPDDESCTHKVSRIFQSLTWGLM
jgi:protein ECT2